MSKDTVRVSCCIPCLKADVLWANKPEELSYLLGLKSFVNSLLATNLQGYFSMKLKSLPFPTLEGRKLTVPMYTIFIKKCISDYTSCVIVAKQENMVYVILSNKNSLLKVSWEENILGEMPMPVIEELASLRVAGTDLNMVCCVRGSGLQTQVPVSIPFLPKFPSYFTTLVIGYLGI